MYWELYRADIKKTSTLPDIFVIKKQAEEKIKDGVIPIGIINMFYNTIKPNAIYKGQLKFENNQLKDVLPRNETPYETKRCFTIAALSESILSGNNTFVFNSDLYFSNTGESIQSIIVDLDDGMGKRNLMMNQPFTINCLTSGIKSISIAVQTNSNQTYFTKTTINIVENKEGYFYQKPNKYVNFSLFGIEGQLGIYYHRCEPNLQNTVPDPVIRKPFLIVKGFDPENKKNFDEDLSNHNTIDATDLYDIANTDYHILDKLRAEGFDICILNWGDSRRNLHDNALVLREAIIWINEHKQGNEELVIIGPSMGGLLTRYVLAKMEQENTPHHTRLYISFDSPHQGANMPLGYQHAIDYMLDNADIFTFGLIQWLEDFRQRLDCDAAKQMLFYHHTATEGLAMDANPTQMKIDFYNELHALNPPYNGYPHLCKKIAIAEGSGNGLDQGFIENKILLICSAVTPYALFVPSYTINLEIRALPDDEPRPVFYGQIHISPFPGMPYVLFSLKIVNIDNSKPYDNCPGGNYPFHITFNNYIHRFLVPSLSDRDHNDCFMPVTTALDLANGGNVLVNIINGGSNIQRNYPNCPFEEFYIPNENEPHVVTGITAGMANWLLQNITQGTIFIQNKTIANKIDYNARYRILVGHNVDIFYPRGDVSVLPDGELYLKSGGDILIDDGFYVDNGSVFYANIEPYPCPPYVSSFSKSFTSTGFNEEKNNSNETTFFNKSENNVENEITVYPIPTNEIINIEIKNYYNNINIVFYNISGKKLFEKTIKQKEKNTIRIDISNFPSGVYFLKTILDNKIIINKIIKSE